MSKLSFVIPVKNEAPSLLILYKELQDVLITIKKPYEIIFIDDGSEDNSYQLLQKLQTKDKNIQVIKFRRNRGKSAALSAGFEKATGDTIIMLDADLQDNPREIPKLVEKQKEGYDLVTGWRQKRHDSADKKLSSYLFNRGTSLVSGVQLHDFNCGLKLMSKQVAEEIYLYGELHRFIPILAAKRQFKVAEVPILHRTRRFGKSNYGFGRGWRAILDLFTSLFLTDYASKPAHFFGKIGLLFFGLGFVLDAYVTFIKITTGSTQGRIPLFLAGILGMILGLQLISTGLIAEMMNYYYHRLSRQMKK